MDADISRNGGVKGIRREKGGLRYEYLLCGYEYSYGHIVVGECDSTRPPEQNCGRSNPIGGKLQQGFSLFYFLF